MTIGQAAWALMFVAFYIAAAAGLIVAIHLSSIVTFSLRTFLLVFLISVTTAAILALYFHLFRRNALTPTDLGFKRPSFRMLHLLWQIPTAIIVSACVQGIFLAVLTFLGLDTSTAEVTDDPVADIKSMPFALAAIAMLIICVFTPLWEEVLFRGALLTGFARHFRPGTAVILSAILFAAVHIVLLGFAYLFVLGAALAILRRFHQNLWAPVILHAANNTVGVLLVLTI